MVERAIGLIKKKIGDVEMTKIDQIRDSVDETLRNFDQEDAKIIFRNSISD
jgi:hypothetical protein